MATAEVGGDVGQAAKGAVEGAIAGARDVGLSAEAAASAAATGALQGAGEVSSAAVEQVSKTATGLISGVKVRAVQDRELSLRAMGLFHSTVQSLVTLLAVSCSVGGKRRCERLRCWSRSRGWPCS